MQASIRGVGAESEGVVDVEKVSVYSGTRDILRELFSWLWTKW